MLRALRVQTVENARTDAKIQALLHTSGLKTPEYVSLKSGDVVGTVEGKNFTISQFLAGHHHEDRTLELAASFGKTLARIHATLADKAELVQANTAQWLNITNAHIAIANCPQPLQLELDRRLEDSVKIFNTILPKTIIHGDLILDNTFAEGNEVSVLFDFETAEYTFRLFDIARTYISFAHDNVLDRGALKQTLIDSYSSVAELPLTDSELQSFPLALAYVGAACAAWLENNNGHEYVPLYLAVTA